MPRWSTSHDTARCATGTDLPSRRSRLAGRPKKEPANTEVRLPVVFAGHLQSGWIFI